MVLDYNDHVTCQLDTVGEVAFYRFQGTAGQRVLIALKASYHYGPCAALYNPAGTLVQENCPWGGYVAASEYTLAATGLFTVRVHDNGYDHTWSYTFYIERLNPPYSATPISYGQTMNGSTDPALESDQYVFGGTAGDSIAVQMTSSYHYGPVVEVYKPSGDRIQIVAPWGGYVARLEFVLPETGTYLIRTSDNGRDHSFTYSLLLQCLGSCTGNSPVFPSVTLALTGCTACSPGSTFSARLTTTNFPSKTSELKVGFYYPDNRQEAAGDPHLELPPGFSFNGDFLRLPITGSHPPGAYRVCARIVELAAGDILAASCQNFTVVP
jgi:hypothetical protein